MARSITEPAQDQLHVRPVERLLVEPDPRKPKAFTGRLRTGEVIVRGTRQPLCDGARVMLTRGCDPNRPLTMRMHDRAYDSFNPAPIGELAKWTYKEREKGGLAVERWMPFAVPRSGQKSTLEAVAALRAILTEAAALDGMLISEDPDLIARTSGKAAAVLDGAARHLRRAP